MHDFLGPYFTSGNLAVIMTAALLGAPANAQTRSDNTQKVAKTSSTKTWIPTRTPDGQPDLEGVWINATLTPFERPAELAGRATITDQEAREIERRASAAPADPQPKAGDPGGYNSQVWSDGGTTWLSTRQTSLVVDPPDGRVPVKPPAEAQRKYNLEHVADSYEYQSTWERCITRGVPAGMFPAGYNNAYQILQSPGYVVIISEMIHEVRLIPIDRPHLPPNVRQWNGDSRGHWEGTTLVVDTTNYNGQGDIATSAATGRIKGIHESEALHVVERFKRLDADTISYEVTINDPETYSAPWKVAMPLTRNPSYRIYEYACHEGNQAMGDILRGGRAKDKAEAAR